MKLNIWTKKEKKEKIKKRRSTNSFYFSSPEKNGSAFTIEDNEMSKKIKLKSKEVENFSWWYDGYMVQFYWIFLYENTNITKKSQSRLIRVNKYSSLWIKGYCQPTQLFNNVLYLAKWDLNNFRAKIQSIKACPMNSHVLNSQYECKSIKIKVIE